MVENASVETVELDLLIEAASRWAGINLNESPRFSLRLRVEQIASSLGARTISALQDMILHDQHAMEKFICEVTAAPAVLFADTHFFRDVREKIAPLLANRAFVRIWHAGCATGEEAYSMAMVLREEGIFDKCRIYATDIGDTMLHSARAGIFAESYLKEQEHRYLAAGGKGSVYDHFIQAQDHVVFDPSLRRSLVFAHHSLTRDACFNHFDLIVCRNVLQYFTPEMQERVLRLFDKSLIEEGILAVGKHESIQFHPRNSKYDEVDGMEGFYRKNEIAA